MRARTVLLLIFVLALAGIVLIAPTFNPISHAADNVPAAPARSVGTAIDDTVITTKVKSALIGDQSIRGFDFKVDTRKGVVQLSGYVDNQAQVERAMQLAKNVEGVMSVDNKVTLKEGRTSIGNKVDDSIVTASVKSALLADTSVKGLQIGVTTRKGVVQLSGFVDSHDQVERAIQIARATDGVQGVNNEMSIKN
jgi:hyperosmotically inducible protein